MRTWKKVLATAALTAALGGAALAEDHDRDRWRDRDRDRDDRTWVYRGRNDNGRWNDRDADDGYYAYGQPYVLRGQRQRDRDRWQDYRRDHDDRRWRDRDWDHDGDRR